MKKISYATSYKVGQGDIRLQVVIGDGQFGSTLVTLGSQVWEQAHDFDHVLGTGVALAGKTLSVTSIVTDTNVQTNQTAVTYRLSGGVVPLEHTVTFTVDDENDSVDYEASIVLA